MKIKLSIFLLISYFSYSQTITKNFDLVVQPKTELSILNYENNNFVPSNLLEDVVYLDGLGKPMQFISKQRNPNNKDIISFVEYNEFGDENKQYFPFYVNQNNINYVPTAKALQSQYYQGKYNDLYPFTDVKLEKSPLKRNLKTSSGGQQWKINQNDDNDRTVKYVHMVNGTEEIINYYVDQAENISYNTYYTQDQLNKVISKGENWVSTDGDLNTIHSYTDKSGKSIANIKFYQENGIIQKAQTNFVYDNKGLLRYILPPKVFKTTTTTYPLCSNFTKFIPMSVFCGSSSSGGGATITVNNNQIQIAFNGGTYGFPFFINTTPIDIDAPCNLPDMGLGSIDISGLQYTGMNVEIKNGKLKISNPYNHSLNGVVQTFTSTFTPVTSEEVFNTTTVNYPTCSNFSTFIPQNVFSNSSGGGGITINVNGGNIEAIMYGYLYGGAPYLINQTPQDIGLPCKLPDMVLGYFSVPGQPSGTTPISVEILNNKLKFNNPSGILISGYNNTFTKIFTPITTEEIFLHTSVLDDLAFQYKYDEFNRKIEQKAPGKAWEYNVFDNLDRPILTQDAKLKENNLWLFTKYDAFGRVILSGLYQNNSTRSQLQSTIDNFIVNSINNKSNIEKRTAFNNLFGSLNINYTNDAFPNSNIFEVHTVNYYDDYNFGDSDKPLTPVNILNQPVTTNTKGLLTATWIKTVGDNDNTYSKIYSYYDKKANQIYSHKKNYLGGISTSQMEYDFRGKVLKTITNHTKGLLATYKQAETKPTESLVFSKAPSNPPPPAIVYYAVEKRYEYDHAERLTGEFEKINTYPEECIVKYEYDELGNLVRKKIGGLTSSIVPLQTVDYTKNIRGWLTKINDPSTLGSDLFAYEIKYNNPTSSSTPIYNGNISQVQWKSALSSTQLETYNYSYDKLNRLVEASYNSNNINTLNFFEKIKYDENDNISFLHRSGDVTSQANLQWMDYMSYYYDGNQLTRIKEEGHGFFGFKTLVSPTNLTPQFEYDTNGNLISDLNKNITLINYNNLNLVEQVLFSSGKTINFKYDALGNKLAKKVVDGSNITTTLYLDGFQYLNGILQFFPNSEGYALHNNGYFLHVYNYTDHLGNNRLSYCDVDNSGDISINEIQSNIDFYPYGMSHSGEFTNSLVSNYLYKFQGKEFQNEGGIDLYDFGSRMYDPALGRWFSPDPQNQFSSPYVAMGNNPILFSDPDGEWAGADDLAAMAIGGTVNLIGDALAGKINGWGDGFVSFGIGAAAGEAGLYGGPVAAGLVLGTLNNVRDQYNRNHGFNNFDLNEVGIEGIKSGFISGVSFGVANKFTASYTNLFSKIGMDGANPLLKDFFIRIASSTSTGFVMGTGMSMADGNSFKESVGVGFQQAGNAALISSVQYGVEKTQAHYKNKAIIKEQADKKLTQQEEGRAEIKKIEESLTRKAERIHADRKAADAIKKVDALIESGTKMDKVKGARQLSVKGDSEAIFKSLSEGGELIKQNQIRLSNGTIITKYPSSSTGVSTLQINQEGKLFKIRIE